MLLLFWNQKTKYRLCLFSSLSFFSLQKKQSIGFLSKKTIGRSLDLPTVFWFQKSESIPFGKNKKTKYRLSPAKKRKHTLSRSSLFFLSLKEREPKRKSNEREYAFAFLPEREILRSLEREKRERN